MTIEALAAQAATYFPRFEDDTGYTASPLPGLLLLQHEEPTPMKATLYEPVACLILQGRKETVLGDTSVRLGPGKSMVVSHDLPVRSRITSARTGKPYLAMILTLNVPMLRGLYEELGPAVVNDTGAQSLAVHDTDARLLDGFGRYLSLASDPVDAKVMAPLVEREIHYRLLRAPHGGMLRRLLRHDSHASMIARAIARIRRDFRDSIAIPEVAREIGMSPSAFYQHFRDITSTTPLQYQKELRLLEARRLLSEGAHSVSRVAYDVGYESPNQFSREYTRKFGVPPRSHLPESRAALAS